MYQLNFHPETGKVSTIKRNTDNASIPLCSDNSDYQDFLEWNKKQAVPLDLNSIDVATVTVHEAQIEQSAIDFLINQKMKDLAIAELKKEGKLDATGKILNKESL